MQTSATSRLAKASPLAQARKQIASLPHPQLDQFEKSSPPESIPGWKGLALAGLAVLGVAGGAQAAQAQVQAAPRPADLGKVSGLLLPKGKVDHDGTIRNPIGWPVGKVKADGTITGPAGLVPKGRVDDKGRVYAWGEFFQKGRVDSDGTVRNNFGVKVGSVQGEDPARLEQFEKGGAALLLLMQD